MASLSKAAVIWTVVAAGVLSIIGCEPGESSSPPKTAYEAPRDPAKGFAASHADTRDAETAAGPEEAVVYEGLVAGKNTILGTNKIKYRILILRKVDEQTAVNGMQRDLEQLAIASNGAWYEVSREQFDLIRRGQRVKVVSTNEQLDMRPPVRAAQTVDILQEPEEPFHFKFLDDVITGTVRSLDANQRRIELDISAWVNRDKKGAIEDIGHVIRVNIDEETVLRDEQERKLKLSFIKTGDKLNVVPAGGSYRYDRDGGQQPLRADRIIRLEQTRKEKLRRLIAQGPGGIHTVLMDQAGSDASEQWDELAAQVPGALYGGYSAIEYREGDTVDYKLELGLDRLLAYLVFDREDLLFRTESVKELQRWFNLRAAEQR
ncbi:hypothetical protein BBD41_16745 [Paenibacillus ihbetae]|uniref:Uncharacterized protein n=1 Tax=Paenibacillus ihbetae TaxID=1870820 RepID=A0A1B2E279_9BACL|nr:hypothetical protein [Paenibacillus ihbetae]ANY74098.1 hypothetical protein BBD41_16745 [Paenibacillus ihbetae]